MDISDRNLERLLSQHALVDPGQLAEAKLAQEKPRLKPSLQSVLLNMGYLKEEVLLQAAAKDLGVPFVDVDPLSPEPSVVLLVPEEVGMTKGVLALEQRGQQLLCAMQDPNDLVTLDLIERRT